jgi:hypothetical protein
MECKRYTIKPALSGQDWGIYWHDAKMSQDGCPWHIPIKYRKNDSCDSKQSLIREPYLEIDVDDSNNIAIIGNDEGLLCIRDLLNQAALKGQSNGTIYNLDGFGGSITVSMISNETELSELNMSRKLEAIVDGEK